MQVNTINTTKSLLTLDDTLSNIQHDLGQIIKKISLSTKIISGHIRRAGIDNHGSTTITNFHGEEVKTLDVVSNNTLITNLSKCSSVRACISEEDMDIIDLNKDGDYIVTFDPLDGSSNIDANINVGTIFGIFKKISNNTDIYESDYLQPGKNMLASGYALYGASTMFVMTTNNGPVNGFTLDINFGEYVLTHPNIKIPKMKKIYSVNEGNFDSWYDITKKIVTNFRSNYSLRYIGSMVADVHRTLLYGGIFMYPESQKSKDGMSTESRNLIGSFTPIGKLRYLYEVAPLSLIIENAGGLSTLGPVFNETRVLNIVPKTIHQRVPTYMGSEDCVKNITLIENEIKKID